MERLCIKTEAWNIRQQIDTFIGYEEDNPHLVAWFEWQYECPALYVDEGGEA